MNHGLDRQLQRAKEAFDLLDGFLPDELKGRFGKVEKRGVGDPHLFPDPPKPPVYAKLRVVPNERNVPESFWNTSWCFYVVGVGPVRVADDLLPLCEDESCVAHVMFQIPHGVAACGKGVHLAPVKRILEETVRKLEPHFAARRMPKRDGEKSFLIRLYKGSPTYQSSGGFPPPEELARDLAALIAHTYPAFVDYAKAATR